MSLPSEFYTNLPSRTDASLYEMIQRPSDYEAEAVEAARSELAKRALPQDRILAAQIAVRAKLLSEDRRRDEPLSWRVRILILLGFWPVLFFGIYYERKGYKRKAKEAWQWFGYRILSWLGLAVVIGLLSER